MKKQTYRLLSLMLCLILVVGMIPGSLMTAHAAGTGITETELFEQIELTSAMINGSTIVNSNSSAFTKTNGTGWELKYSQSGKWLYFDLYLDNANINQVNFTGKLLKDSAHSVQFNVHVKGECSIGGLWVLIQHTDPKYGWGGSDAAYSRLETNIIYESDNATLSAENSIQTKGLYNVDFKVNANGNSGATLKCGFIDTTALSSVSSITMTAVNFVAKRTDGTGAVFSVGDCTITFNRCNTLFNLPEGMVPFEDGHNNVIYDTTMVEYGGKLEEINAQNPGSASMYVDSNRYAAIKKSEDLNNYLNFINQDPAMPSGKTETDITATLDNTETYQFNNAALPSWLADGGFNIYRNGSLYKGSNIMPIESVANGNSDAIKVNHTFDEAGTYKLVEALTLKYFNNPVDNFVDAHNGYKKNTFNITTTEGSGEGGGEETAEIDLVNVTVTEPVADVEAVFDATENHDGCSIADGKISWMKDGITQVNAGAKFAPNTTYRCFVALSAEDGYKFTSDTKVYINGKEATYVRHADEFAHYYYNFTTGAAEGGGEETAEIDLVNVTVTEPVADVEAVFDATENHDGCSIADGKISWMKDGITQVNAGAKFAPNTTYRCFVALSAEDGYKFTSDTKVYINGKEATYVRHADEFAHYYYNFTTGAAEGGAATVTDINVTGTVDTGITVQEFRIYVEGDTFGMSIPADITDWFKNIPTGLKVEKLECAGGRLTVRVSGTPTVASDEVMQIVIPADALTNSDSALTVDTNANAKFNIVNGETPPTEYTITVNGGTASVGAGTAVTKATAGTVITLTVDESAIPAGKVFDKWEVVSGGVTITDGKFTMPESAVEINATYKDAPVIPTEITEVDATVAEPVVGGTPSTVATTTGTDYTVFVSGWYDEEENTVSVFEAGKTYTLEVGFTPKEGYVLAGSKTLNATINDKEAEYLSRNTINGTVTCFIRYTIPAVVPTEINISKLPSLTVGDKITKAMAKNVFPAGLTFIDNTPYVAVINSMGFIGQPTEAEADTNYYLYGTWELKDYTEIPDASQYVVKYNGTALTYTPNNLLRDNEQSGYYFYKSNNDGKIYCNVWIYLGKAAPAQSPTEYDITVIGGTASVGAGTAVTKATTDTVITLTVDESAIPAGKVFDKWEVVSGGVTITDGKFTMPANAVEIRATYKDAPVIPTEINSITIEGLLAPQYGMGVKEYDDNVVEEKIKNGSITVNGQVGIDEDFGNIWSDGARTYHKDESIFDNVPEYYYTAKFEEDTYYLGFWFTPATGYTFADDLSATVDGVNNADVSIKDAGDDWIVVWIKYEITAPSSAPTEYDITVTGGTASANKAVAGTVITLTVDESAIPAGKVFDKWEVVSGGVIITDGKFTMPESAVEIRATYKDAPVSHTCDIKPVAKDEPSCTEGGKEAYYKCEGCGKFYEDALGVKEITDLANWGNLPKLGHTESDWKSDKDNHWKECTVTACGVIIEDSKAAHKDDNKDGKCDVCEYNVGLPTTPDEDKPNDNPQTGNNSNMFLWIALLFVSGAGVVATTVYGKKKFSVK